MTLSSWFKPYPDTAGYKESDTSRKAAEAIDSRTGQLQRLVLNHIVLAGPSTADETASAIGETVLAIRPRFSELLALGKIADTGERRKNASKRSAKVWRII